MSLFSFFKRQKKHDSTAEHDRYDYEQVAMRRHKLMTDGGWFPYLSEYGRNDGLPFACDYERVEFTRNFEEVWIGHPHKIHCQTNIAGLYWRPLTNIIDVTPFDNAKLIEGNHD